MDEGTLRMPLLLDSATAAPPVGAAWERATVHVAELPELRVDGEHATELSTAEVANDRVAVCDTPPDVAVTTAVWLVPMLPAVAVNVAVAAPAPTVTDDGTVSVALLLESATGVFAATAWLIVTVQVEVDAEFKVVGLQTTLLRVAGTLIVMVPPLPLAETAAPLGAAAETFVAAMLTEPEAVADKVAFTTATTPLPIAVWFSPETRQT